MNKRGEGTSAGNVATLVALIALFMLVYILLLPQDERAKLLGTENPQFQYDNGVDVTGNVLVSESPGKLSPTESPSIIVHDITNVNLFTSETSNLVKLSETVRVSKGIFGTEQKQNVIFTVKNPQDLLKSELFMIVEQGVGNLVVKINGNEFFNKEVQTGQLKIEIPSEYVIESNVIEFSVEGFGSKSYQIRDIRLNREEEINNRIARRTFSIDSREKSSMERAVMRYSVFCDRNEDNVLTINLNGKIIFSDVPFCNLEGETIELASNFFNSGINLIDFESNGDYVVEGISIKTFSSEDNLNEYFFTLDDDQYLKVRRGTSNVVAMFEYSLFDDRKAFVIDINGKELTVDTRDDTSLVVLTEFADKENLIRIDPKNSFELLSLKVIME